MNVDIVRPLLTESRKNWFGLITLILAQTIIVLDNVTLMLSADSSSLNSLLPFLNCKSPILFIP